MNITWIIIEVVAILVDSSTKTYFLNSRYVSKQESKIPQLLFWICLFAWGLTATFLSFAIPIYEGVTYSIVFVYLLLSKRGTILHKLFGMVLTLALSLGSSLAGAGLASFITGTQVEHTLLYQDSSRLLAIILIKAIQIVLFYVLSKKQLRIRDLKRKPLLVLCSTTAFVFACLLFKFLNISEFDERVNHIMILLAGGLMFVLIGIFLMYEMFTREEARNIELSSQLQRLSLESHFFRELEAVQSDIRTWRHEYKNNLIALRAWIDSGQTNKALEYLDNLNVESTLEGAMLHTGNTVLDAVVSSKLLLARSRGIDVSIQAVYPKTSIIEDNDLCAIAGNLLDNAIEACERMEETEQPRFITLSMFVKGKNLALSILNSYDGEIKREGTRFVTVKKERFHGIGIRYVDTLVNKYQGHVLREYKEGVFKTHIMLPLI